MINMKCPECGREMSLIDNTSFLSDNIMDQLFGFNPTNYGCFNCNKVIPIYNVWCNIE